MHKQFFFVENKLLSHRNKEFRIFYISLKFTPPLHFIFPDEEICIFLDPLNLQQKHYIFMAVNDNMAANTYGGTHW